MLYKIKKLVLLSLTIIGLNGCSQLEAKCGDTEVLNLVRKLMGENFTQVLGSVFSAEISLEILNPRLNSKNPNTGEMNCSAEIKTVPSTKLKQIFPNEKEEIQTINYKIKNLQDGKFEVSF